MGTKACYNDLLMQTIQGESGVNLNGKISNNGTNLKIHFTMYIYAK